MSQGAAPDQPDPGTPDQRDREEAGQQSNVTALRSARSHDGPHDEAVKIGLWGPPQSGKTTLLAALPVAVSNRNAKNGSWIIFPRDDRSRVLKDRFEKALVEDRRFPESTIRDTTVPLEWLFVGDLAGSTFDRRRLRRLRRSELESRFVLDLIDVHGDLYHTDPDQQEVRSEAAAKALDHLAAAQGIIFVFDPIGEKDGINEQDSKELAAYVRGTVNELLVRAANNRQRPGRHLEQQVSVCITKFDHQELFQQARQMHLVTKGDDGMPRVRDEDAEQFFDELCNGKFWSKEYEAGQQSAEFVRDQLRNIFHEDHIRYFVTSSIGFWMHPPVGDKATAWFDPNDYANYYVSDGRARIRGKVRPINVLEPLISLQQRIARG
jgi:hypothetical protein